MMKKAALIITLVVVVVVAVVQRRATSRALAPAYRESLVYALEQMRHIKMPDGSVEIGGPAAGLRGEPHPFYLLAQYATTVAIPPDIELMLRDGSPAVRIAGAMAFLKRNGLGMDWKQFDVLLADGEPVTILNDCIPRRMTVGEVVAGLKADREFLSLMEKRPNQHLRATEQGKS